MGLRRSINGGLAGGIAAALWAAQQPLDKKLFGSRYDDVEGRWPQLPGPRRPTIKVIVPFVSRGTPLNTAVTDRPCQREARDDPAQLAAALEVAAGRLCGRPPAPGLVGAMAI